MSKISEDRDSLVALDALLRIRGSGRSSASVDGEQSYQRLESTIQSAHETSQANDRQRPCHQPQQVAGLNNLLPLSANVLLQQHAVAAAAAAAATPPAYTSAQLVAMQAAAAALGQTLTGTAQQGKREGTQAKSTNANAAAKRKSKSTGESIRRDKVEAALRSKPQRGRKRDDLSEKERLELTRTRNREHAKSTRIRKKARYQELLDCEEKMKELQKEEDLKTLRCQSFIHFLSIRQAMLGNVNVESAAGRKPEPRNVSQTTAGTSNDTAHGKTPHSDDTRDTTPIDERKPSASHEADFTALLSTVVGDVSQFVFEEKSVLDYKPERRTAQSSLCRMKSWDNECCSRIAETYGENVTRMFAYRIVGGLEGIALSKQGNGFAHVELVVNSDDPKILLKGCVSVVFAAGSNQLTTVCWTTLEDNTVQAQQKMIRENFRQGDRLGSQLIHPSVVSLDVDKTMPDEAHGPGMNI